MIVPASPVFDEDDILSWVFQFDTTGSVGDTAHIKYLYVDEGGEKVGSLGSWDTDIQRNGQEIPEPSTLSLVGGTVLALAFFTYRRRKTLR
jgi:hypothetical protein